MNSTRKHLGFLDHFRGIAILFVLLFHTALVATVETPDLMPWQGGFRDFSHATLSSALLFPLSFGQCGVPIFFVISGFCIHLSFQKHGKTWKDFFIRRIFRIYPAYVAALVFFAAGVFAGSLHFNLLDENHRLQFLTHFFLVHNFNPTTYLGINGAFWSLAIEFQLYLLFPLLLALSGIFGWRRTLVFLAGCELVINGLTGLQQTADDPSGAGGQVADFLSRSVLHFWFSWALGACLADAFLKNKPLPFLKPSPAFWLTLLVASYFIRPMAPFWFTLTALTTAAMFSRLLSRPDPQVKLPALPLRILKNFGTWSYSLYLMHYPLMDIYRRDFEWAVPDQHQSVAVNLLFALLTWLAIIPISILWYNLFESPGIELGQRILKKLNGAQPGKPAGSGKNGSNHSPILTRSYYLMVGVLAALILVHLWKF